MTWDNFSALWSCIRCVLSDEEAQRFLRLRNISTDSGRGRAWLRASLNERSLERYLHAILGDKQLLEYVFLVTPSTKNVNRASCRRIYEDWAFLRDPDLSETLPQIAKGMEIILRFPIAHTERRIWTQARQLNGSRSTQCSNEYVQCTKSMYYVQ